MDKRKKTVSITETKYQVTSCCFCNEIVDNNDFKVNLCKPCSIRWACDLWPCFYRISHFDECAQALQKCPNGCVAYIERKNIDEHLLECPRKAERLKRCSAKEDLFDEIDEDSYLALEQSITSLRTALHEEIRQRHRLIADVGGLRRAAIELSEQRTLDTETFQHELDSLKHQHKEIQEWRKELRNLLNSFHEDLEFRNDAALNFEVLFTGKDFTVSKIKSLETEIESIKTEQHKIKSRPNSRIEDDNGSVASLVTAVDRCRRCTFLEWKLSESLLEIRQMKNTVCESEVKCDKCAKTVDELQRICVTTKQELADLQAHLAAEKRMTTITNSEGHLIWRIDNYSAKLKEAKDTDVSLKSPIFCDQQYGYNLRLEVSLDGFGKWKGRNILACLNVVPGEWDPLLSWPCKLKADIFLRDQADESSSRRNLSKNIIVRKQEESYDRNQYIFIPHGVASNFVKNDCIFFEVFIQNLQGPNC